MASLQNLLLHGRWVLCSYSLPGIVKNSSLQHDLGPAEPEFPHCRNFKRHLIFSIPVFHMWRMERNRSAFWSSASSSELDDCSQLTTGVPSAGAGD